MEHKIKYICIRHPCFISFCQKVAYHPHCSESCVFPSRIYLGRGDPLQVCTSHSFKWRCSIPLFKCTIINVTSLLMMDIWVVSSLQWPGEGAEDVYLEFQGASGTHLPGCARFLAGTWIVFSPRLRSGRLEDIISRVCSRWHGLLQDDPSTVYYLKNVFLVVISWELAPDSLRLKSLIRLSATSEQLGNLPPVSSGERWRRCQVPRNTWLWFHGLAHCGSGLV